MDSSFFHHPCVPNHSPSLVVSTSEISRIELVFSTFPVLPQFRPSSYYAWALLTAPELFPRPGPPIISRGNVQNLGVDLDRSPTALVTVRWLPLLCHHLCDTAWMPRGSLSDPNPPYTSSSAPRLPLCRPGHSGLALHPPSPRLSASVHILLSLA